MDFNDTPEEAAYRAKARAWLAENGTPKGTVKGPDYHEKIAAQNWQAKKADAGYACITWPKEWGGAGGTPIENVIYRQEEEKYETFLDIFVLGLGICLPAMMVWAPAEVSKRYVGPAVRGDEVWCQLFSEPAAGSDLAGIRTRAEKDGDDWIVNGQKVWTSYAHYADYGMMLVRTDPSVPKHKGLTMFYVDMKSPGIEVRSIRQMSGATDFNEVFFTDVRLSDSQRVGKVGEGWKVALTALMNERLSIGGNEGKIEIEHLVELARKTTIDGKPALEHGAVRERIADWHVQSQGIKFTSFRTLTALSRGDTPGPESSIAKIVTAKKMQDMGAFAMELQDLGGVIRDEKISAFAAEPQYQWFEAAGIRIAGGTDEILRNIIAERVLGMPQDIRVDKDIAFNQMPRGA